MFRAFTLGAAIVVATATWAADLRMIYPYHRHPALGIGMAGIAFFAGFDMSTTFTFRFNSVMTTNAIAVNPTMIKAA